MKKYLLGAMMLVGSLAYGQANQVIVPLTASGSTGSATANLGIEVVGKVFQKTDPSLVVDIKSAASPDGRGFAFQMSDMFVDTKGEPMIGKFTAKIVKGTDVLPLTQEIVTELVKGDDANGTPTVGANSVVGTASDTTVSYALSGKSQAGDVEHNGTISVFATTGSIPGQYSDNTVSLRVKVANQNVGPMG